MSVTLASLQARILLLMIDHRTAYLRRGRTNPAFLYTGDQGVCTHEADCPQTPSSWRNQYLCARRGSRKAFFQGDHSNHGKAIHHVRNRGERYLECLYAEPLLICPLSADRAVFIPAQRILRCPDFYLLGSLWPRLRTMVVLYNRSWAGLRSYRNWVLHFLLLVLPLHPQE